MGYDTSKNAIQAHLICFYMCIKHSKYVSMHVEVCSWKNSTQLSSECLQFSDINNYSYV